MAVFVFCMFFMQLYKRRPGFCPAVGIYHCHTGGLYYNIVYACFLKGEKSCKKLALYDMVLKLIHIPFYGIVFLAGLLLFGTIVVPALIFVTPTIILILFFVDVCLMVTTSMYGVSALVQAARKKEVSKLYACIHVILHFLFVTDVVSAFWVYIKIRKSARKKSAEM